MNPTSKAGDRAAAKTLLAAACAGLLAPVVAEATPFVEATDFGNTFATRTTLPAGTDNVAGTVNTTNDLNDFYRLTGLPANQPITIGYSASYAAPSGLADYELDLFTDTQSQLVIRQLFPNAGGAPLSSTVQVTVPADGVLVARSAFTEGGNGVISYTLSVPEPSAAATLAGIGALALLGGRRRPQQQPTPSDGPGDDARVE